MERIGPTTTPERKGHEKKGKIQPLNHTTGKERKGKDMHRGGQDKRKGKERNKCKERKGKDRKGKERTRPEDQTR